jgi:hypothetical protein
VAFWDYQLASKTGNIVNFFGDPVSWEIPAGETYPKDSEFYTNLSDEEKTQYRQGYMHPWWESSDRYFSWFSDQCVEDAKTFTQYLKPVVIFSSLYSLPSEDIVLKDYWSGAEGINAYVNEMTMKFMNGEEPLTNWDQYVAQVQALGIDKVTEVNQAKWDRMLKSAGQL